MYVSQVISAADLDSYIGLINNNAWELLALIVHPYETDELGPKLIIVWYQK